MEPLKNMYNITFVKAFTDIAESVFPEFDGQQFSDFVFDREWDKLELKQRVRRLSTALNQQMNGDFSKDVVRVRKLAQTVHNSIGKDNVFEYMFLPDYLEQYGIEHPNEALDVMEVITKLCSCEFAIRPFIIAHTEYTLNKMLTWTNDEHPSVRRLASEGCRPRLPWGMALVAFKREPGPVLPILEKLKSDSSEFVRKSVANNLNDIAKDNPDLVLDIAKRWIGNNERTNWIVKHGCRSLLKRADARALALFGLSASPVCSITDLKLLSAGIAIGEALSFSFSLINDDKESKRFRVEYVITYAKANNKQSKKVFKITENSYAPGVSVAFKRKQSFADMTTRRHYPGEHRLAIAVNGVEKASATFHVVAR